MIREEAFWEFMIARERIRLARAHGRPREEWTDDPIFKKFSFTNVKRENDRTTHLLIENFYSKNQYTTDRHPNKIALLNATIFRYFGTIEMALAVGWHQSWHSGQKQRLIEMSAARLAVGQTVFTPAYIVPNCGSCSPKHEIVAEVVDSIWKDADLILDTNSWKEACERLCRHWGVGSFMAKEVLLDYILITKWRPSDWTTWTPVGPGGRRGAGVVKYDVIKGIPEWEALTVIKQLYHNRAAYWPDDFVPLDLTDIQFQLCEFAKYRKAQTGIGSPKRLFRPTIDSVTEGISTL